MTHKPYRCYNSVYIRRMMATMKVFVFLSTVVIFFNQLSGVNSQKIHSIRLTGGSNLYTGRLEVLYCANISTMSCAWAPVHWSGWTETKAVVACRQLDLYDEKYTVEYRNGGFSVDQNTVVIQCDQTLSNKTLSLNGCTITYLHGGDASFTILTCAIPLEPPTLTVSGITSTSATVKWTLSNNRSTSVYYVRCTNGYHSHSHIGPAVHLYELTPYTYYNCCVSGIDSKNVVGSEGCIPSFRTHGEVPLAAPSNLRIMELQTRSITLQWDELTPSEKAGPQVKYSLSTASVSGCPQPSTTELFNTHTTVSGLSPYCTYSIFISACKADNVNECGPISPPIQVQTLEDAPSNVNNVLCTAISSTQINVSWTQPNQLNGVIRYYEINVTNTVKTNTQLVNGHTNKVTISHLQPNQSYTCSVAAYTVSQGQIVSIENIHLPQPRVHFNCSAYNESTIQVTWNLSGSLVSDLSGPIEYYSVTLWDAQTNRSVYSEEIRSLTDYSRLVTPPVLYNNYRCSVAAYGKYNIGLIGTQSVWIPETVSFGPPLHLEITNKTSRSFRVRWQPPRVNILSGNTQIQSYHVRVYSNETSEWYNETVASTALNYDVTLLHPNYHYKISVSATAWNTTDHQGPTNTTLIQTEEEAPSGTPQDLVPFNITKSSFKLNWSEPSFDMQNGHITRYRIKVTDAGNVRQPLMFKSITKQVLIAPLEGGTTYRVSVAAMTKVGIGPYTTTISVTTNKDNGTLAIALYSTIAVLFAIILLLFGISLHYTMNISKIKRQRGLAHRRIRSTKHSSRATKSTECYSTRDTFIDEDEGVKPPAVPPKTYLEEEDEDEEIRTSQSPSDEDISRPNYDNCSLDSDSLCDMILETINEGKVVKPPAALPKTYLEGEDEDEKGSASECQSDEDTTRPIYDNCSLDSDCLYDMKLEAMEDFIVPESPRRKQQRKPLPTIRVAEHVPESSQSQESHYQKLNLKSVDRPAVYEDINTVRMQKKMMKSSAAGDQSQPARGQYETLQLQSMEGPRKYEQISLKTAPSKESV